MAHKQVPIVETTKHFFPMPTLPKYMDNPSENTLSRSKISYEKLVINSIESKRGGGGILLALEINPEQNKKRMIHN